MARRQQVVPATAPSVSAALEIVRAAIDSVSSRMRGAAYRAFLEELLADAEGWRMQLAEDEGDTGEAREASD